MNTAAKYCGDPAAFYKAILDSIDSTICVIDAQGRIVFVNEAWKRFDRENDGGDRDWIGISYLNACPSAQATPPEDASPAGDGIQAVIDGKLPRYILEYPCHSPTEKRWFSMSVRPLQWPDEKLFVIKHKNITERKLAEIQVRMQNQDLERSNRELDEFASIASHDLQEPVRTIASMTKMIAEDPETVLSEQGQQAQQFMLESCERMFHLIHGLLEHGRLGRGATPGRVDVGAMLADIQKDMQFRITERGAQISVSDSLPTLTLFPVEIRLLFQNLISNALKFCPPERHPVVSITARQVEPQRWRFCLKDNGIGIPESQREKAFTMFQRSAGSEMAEGTGIGLAHCRKIAALHGGRIWVESSSPEGTTFCIELEEVLMQANPQADPQPEASGKTS